MAHKRDLAWLKDWRVLIFSGGCLFAGFILAMLIFGSPWHLPPAWGDIPTWITAIATIGLLIGAVITAVYAVKDFRDQARQIAGLQKENERQADERRRAQARSVFIAVPPRSMRLVQPAAHNASDYPIFGAQFWYDGPGDLVGPDELGMIMPGPVALNGRQMSYDEAVEGAILTFRDAEGISWIRLPGGVLKEQDHGTVRGNVLTALGRPIPIPAEPATESAEEPEAPPEQ